MKLKALRIFRELQLKEESRYIHEYHSFPNLVSSKRKDASYENACSFRKTPNKLSIGGGTYGSRRKDVMDEIFKERRKEKALEMALGYRFSGRFKVVRRKTRQIAT